MAASKFKTDNIETATKLLYNVFDNNDYNFVATMLDTYEWAQFDRYETERFDFVTLVIQTKEEGK